MKQSHFAVLTQMVNGHVYPVLPLCTELVRRGHRVTYVTNEHYANLISETGAEPVIVNTPRMPDDLKEEIKIGLPLPITDPRCKRMYNLWRAHFFCETTESLPEMKRFYLQNVPDLILYDRYRIPGRILTKHLGVPAVQMSGHFAFHNGFAMRRSGVCENPDVIIEWSKDLDAFLSIFGITSHGSYWHVEDLNLYFIPKEFQHHNDCFDERFCFIGALLDRPFHAMWGDRPNSSPVILISGTALWDVEKIDSREDFNMVVNALSEVPYQCILSLGNGEFSRQLPANFELNRRVSHLEILPHALLSICHGGMTSTLEALYHGVPVLIIPEGEAGEEVAYRVEELGLGVRLGKNLASVKTIRETVVKMLTDDVLLKRVKHMQDVFRSSGGAKLAANRIEHYLADQRC